MLWACGQRACVVHKSTAAAFRLAEAIAGVMSDSAKHDRSVGDGPAIRVLGEADRLADERSTDVDRVASPLDLAVVADTPDCSFAAVFRRAQDAVPGSRRDAIVLSGRVVAERLVRALFIVDTLEVLEALQLLAQGACRRFGGVLQERQVQPLQPTILLRLARCNALGDDARFDHLPRQLREAAHTTRSKRRPVVGPQRLGQAELAEGRVDNRPDMIVVGTAQRLAAQQVTAVSVPQREWFTMSAVAGQEPTLEVDAPNIVGGIAMRKRRARWRTASAQPSLHSKALALEQFSYRARCRPDDLRGMPLEPGPYLHRSPGRMFPPRHQAPLRDRSRYCLRVIERSPRTIDQALHAACLVAHQPLVAGPTAHAEAPAHSCKRLFLPLNHHDKAHPLIHGTGLHPSHRQGPPCRSVDLLPMSPVYSVTHVAVLDRLGTLSRRGRGFRSARHAHRFI